MSTRILCPDCNFPMETTDSEICICLTCIQLWELEQDGGLFPGDELIDEAYFENIHCPACTSKLIDTGFGEGVCMTCVNVWKVIPGVDCYQAQTSDRKHYIDTVKQYRTKFIDSASSNNELFEKMMHNILKSDKIAYVKILEMDSLLAAKKSLKNSTLL